MSAMRRDQRKVHRVVLAVLSVALLGGCGVVPPTTPTPSQPAPEPPGPKPNVAGVWRGEVTVADCWRMHGDGTDPCDVRRGKTAPIVLTISHISTATPDVDLRIALVAFDPAAQGTCYGTRDASGSIFFQGLIRRAADEFDALVTFRGQIDGRRMESLDEMIDVNVTMRNGVNWQLLGERWSFSPILRQ
jgi:hypothetical protein